jgi:putative transcriptional regulator
MYSLLYIMYSKLYYALHVQEVSVELNNHLKKLRFEHGQISQQALANAVGVTRLTIHSIENGKFNPSTLLALKIARFFELPLEEVFFIQED